MNNDNCGFKKLFAVNQHEDSKTEALQVSNRGCVVRTTEWGEGCVSTALCFVPDVYVKEVKSTEDEVIERKLIAYLHRG